jgi:hypothetical protein
MKNKAYYHIYMPDDLSWTYIFIDQMREMLESGVMEKLDELTIISIGDEESTKHLFGLLNYYNYLTKVKIKVNYFDKKNTDKELINIDGADKHKFITETQTLQTIWEDAKNSDEWYNILYFHTKGVTAIERVLKVGDYGRFVNYLHWRKHCEWSIFDKFEESIELLKTHDAVGANFSAWPTPHFSGNMWWTNSKYISTLSNPNDVEWWKEYKKKNKEAFAWLPDRLVGEMWIGSGDNAKLFSYYNHPRPPPQSNLGQEIILRKEYYK